MSIDFRIAETRTFQKKIFKGEYQHHYSRARERLYPQLRENPYSGPNVKKLKGDLSGVYRYRIGDYRLFYTIDTEKKLVFMLDMDNRKDSYKE